MIIVTLVFLVMIIGLIMYALSKDGKIMEIGRIMFFCGLFAICLESDRIYTLITK